MKLFNEYRKYVEENLTSYLPKVESISRTLDESMRYSLLAGGKRLRPVLLLAACDLAGGETKLAIPYACAIEYIHTYSLVHDDLPAMDDDDLRRGKPTNHKVYGAGMATLAGDGLLNSAYEAMIMDMFFYFDSDKAEELRKRVRAAAAIAGGAGVKGMVAGQVADIENCNGNCTGEVLRYIQLNKTAAMIVGAVRAGLFLGGATEEMISDFTIYGENLGLAFQTADDVLDQVGSTEELGKNVGKDEEDNKLTSISIYGLEGAKDKVSKYTELACKAIEKYGEDAQFFIDLARKLEDRSC